MQTANLIGGDWVRARDGADLTVTNPATNDVIASVPAAGAAETQDAIAAAAAALPEWRERSASNRAEPLRRLAALLHEQRERLAALITEEQGKPLAEARGEITYAASFIDWAAEEAKRVYGEIIPAASASKRILVLRQPVGVTAAITPWNFPTAMLTRKLGPALAAGCTMVVKPAEQTPLSALALGELAVKAGLPDGVVNIVTGPPAAIGAEIMASPTVRKVSFTGSTEVGKQLMAAGAQTVTRLSLELGGHAPFLVFDDADVSAAAQGAMASKFRNMGQTCICANRFLIQDGIYDSFVEHLHAAVEGLRVGRGTDEGVTVGPLIDDAAMDKVESHVIDALDRGAHLRLGGHRARPGGHLADRFYAPTILENVDSEMLVSREETFGPVAPLRRFASEGEAIALANDSCYGLAAYVYTRDASRLMRVSEALEYGIIGANDGAPSVAQAPFGGVKESGFGREGGHHVMHEYVDVKFVSWQL